MAAKTVLNYLDRDSVIHKMTGTTKLAFFLLFTFASMITYNTWVLLGLFVVSLAAFRLSKIKYREVRFMMIFMLVFLLLNNLFIFLFDPNQGTTLYGTRHVLCHLFWRYDLTAEQLFYMVNISLKYFVALPVAILFISATNPSEFAASLNSIGISYKVGYSVAIALRYIPDIQRDYHSISQAQQARGVELGKNEHFFARLKNSYQSESDRYNFQCYGTEGIRQTQKTYLVHQETLCQKRFPCTGAGCDPASGQPYSNHPLWQVL